MSVLGKYELKARYARLLGNEAFGILTGLAQQVIADVRQRYVGTGAIEGRLYYKYDGWALPTTDEAVEHMTSVLIILIYEDTKEYIDDLSIECGQHNSVYVSYKVSAPSVD